MALLKLIINPVFIITICSLTQTNDSFLPPIPLPPILTKRLLLAGSHGGSRHLFGGLASPVNGSTAPR